MSSVNEKYISLYQEMASLCEQNGWGDPFSYARSKRFMQPVYWGTVCLDLQITLALML